MLFYKNLRLHSVSFLTVFWLACGFLLAPFTASCSAVTPQQSEEQALQLLRQLTRDGKLPPENVVSQIEATFPKGKTGALAKLLRARIHFESGDFGSAAQILNADVFRRKTNLADYALWLRGRSLQQAGNHLEAMNVFAELVRDFPNSLRTRDAKLLWANSAMQSGQAAQIPAFLQDLIDRNDADALFLTAKSFETQNNPAQAIKFYRKVYFYGAGTDAAKESETKLNFFAQSPEPQTADEISARAERLYDTKNYAEAATAYTDLVTKFPASSTSKINLRRVFAFANTRKTVEAQAAFDLIPLSASEKEQGFYELARAYARARQWEQARQTVEDMRQKFPKSAFTPKTLIAVGMLARDAKNKADESYFLRSAVAAYPNAIEVAQAQFELAWMEHENNNFPVSSQMLTEHLARYVDKDSTNRGKAGYWAARDSERAGKTAEACALYDAVLYRYGANWYGYLALQRLASLRALNRCSAAPQFPAGSLIPQAAANLKTVTVAAETSTPRELERAEKADELGAVGLFDWAIEELQEAQKTAPNSPKINMAIARHFRFKEDNVSAFLALAKSYPDYSQMFPEEMSREEWDIFYPLRNWSDIKTWAKNRNLDSYQVAGLIRQESVFNPRAKSNANAYGLMQLLVPTARVMAKKYNSTASEIYAETLFNPALNIELGTAYIREQFDRFGRIEFVAAAYNAGPNRVPQWQATLPPKMDDFVEAIPFRETKSYVQGVIRNSAQYRRLYDENGNFKENVGAKPLRGEIDEKPREQFVREFPDVTVDANKTAE